MKQGIEIPTQFLVSAEFIVTRKCNFPCSHCLRGQEENIEMQPDDYRKAVGAINNPGFTAIGLSGGEARLLSWYPNIGNITRQALGANGQLAVDQDPALAALYRLNSKPYDLPSGTVKEWKRSGQLLVDSYRRALEAGIVSNDNIKIFLDTNCFGLDDPFKVAVFLREAYQQGVNNVRFSNDVAHIEAVSKMGAKVDYPFIKDLVGVNNDEWDKVCKSLGIPHNMWLINLGTPDYALPVGRAVDLTLEERVRLAGIPVKECPKAAQKIRRKLNWEETHWGEILGQSWVVAENGYSGLTNCSYCPPAIFYRKAEQVMAFLPQNRLHRWKTTIFPNLDVNLCFLDCIPPIGNFKQDDPETIYQRALNSRLYEILGYQGPAGVAKEITGWRAQDISNKNQEGPCRICHDLKKEYPQELKSLMMQPSSFGQPRTSMPRNRSLFVFKT